jgi:diacylglycerol O-acyltransferase / wax synthase
MKSLTGLDATFLYLETPEMPMHVGALHLCELPVGFRGSFHKAVQRHIAGRMHLAPVFSRKLVFMPLDLGHPVWVDADSVDIDFHVRRAGPPQASTASSGGSAAHQVASVGANNHRRADPARKSAAPKNPVMTLAAAQKLCARLHGEPLDRKLPLWAFYIFDRIRLPASQGGQVVAGFFSKIHHAALDGKAAMLLANALLDPGPVPREVAPPDPSRRRRLESDLKLGRMIGSVFSSSLGQLARAARSLPLAASTLGGSIGQSLARQSADRALGSKTKMPLRLAPRTTFNRGIEAGRVFVTATLPLADCRAMGKAVGGSFNDIVLWICSTALRQYLAQHHTLPKKSLVAAMPVSLREAGAVDATELGNQVSMALVELGTHLAHPLKRMNAILASTAKVKTSMSSLKGLLPTDYPSLLAPWLVGGAARLAFSAAGKSNLVGRLPMLANLAISNVPGSPVPLYLAGARILSFHPLSIIVHGLALNITIQTYDGHVDFGIVADKKALPHAGDLARAIEAAFAEAQAVLAPATQAPSTSRASTTPASVKTRQHVVPKATKTSKLEQPLSTARRKRADTAS